MAQILSTFNFKKVPKVFLLVIAMILAVEFSCFVVIHLIKKDCGAHGDLIRADHSFFCENYRKFRRDEFHELAEAYESPKFKSLEDIRKQGPYDILIMGDSTGTTGWAELLKRNYGLKVLNLTTVSRSDGWPNAVIRVLRDYEKINGNRKALWIYTGLTERVTSTFLVNAGSEDFESILSGKKVKPLKDAFKTDFANFLYSSKLYNYHKSRAYLKSEYDAAVLLKNFDDRTEMFYMMDVDGYKNPVKLSKREFEKAHEQFRKIQSAVAEANGQLIFVATPTKPFQYAWLMDESQEAIERRRQEGNVAIIKQIAQEIGMPFLNMEEVLRPIAEQVYAESSELLWFSDDTHMSLKGATYSAEMIYAFLRKNRLI